MHSDVSNSNSSSLKNLGLDYVIIDVCIERFILYVIFLNIKQSMKTKVCNLTKIDSDSTNSTLLNIPFHKK